MDLKQIIADYVFNDEKILIAIYDSVEDVVKEAILK